MRVFEGLSLELMAAFVEQLSSHKLFMGHLVNLPGEPYRDILYVRMDGWMDGCMDGWMDEWMDGWMDGWMFM
jgi:hypothetical protein